MKGFRKLRSQLAKCTVCNGITPILLQGRRKTTTAPASFHPAPIRRNPLPRPDFRTVIPREHVCSAAARLQPFAHYHPNASPGLRTPNDPFFVTCV